jgi:site-specific DNA recombinase
MDVGIYTRLSEAKATVEATDEAVDRQEQRCRALAAAKGWHVVEPVYLDEDLTAFRRPGKRKPPPRPAFERMLVDVEAGRIQGIVFAKLDRLVRDHGDFERVLAVCETHKAVLASVIDPLDTSTPHGEAMARMGVTFARLESQTTGLRVAAQREQAARAGKPTPGGWRPYGYLPDKLTVDEDEARFIRWAAERLLFGKSVTEVAAAINAAGARGPTGKQFTTTKLRQTLLSPRLAGLRAYKGEILGPATWPAILPREQWEALRALLTDPGKSHPGRPRKYLLVGGLARCGRDGCGQPLVTHFEASGRRQYICTRRPGRPGCGRLKVAAAALEDVVVEMVLARDWRHLDTRAASTADMTALAGELADAEVQLIELGRLHARRRISTPEWLDQRDVIAEQIAELNARRDEARRAISPGTIPTGGEALRAWWDDEDTTVEQKRAALDRVLRYVLVKPATRRLGRAMDADRVEPVWRA